MKWAWTVLLRWCDVLRRCAGVALLASTLNHLAKMADKCPFTFVTTHFREVFDFDLLRTRHLVSLLHMDFLKEKTEASVWGSMQHSLCMPMLVINVDLWIFDDSIWFQLKGGYVTACLRERHW